MTLTAAARGCDVIWKLFRPQIHKFTATTFLLELYVNILLETIEILQMDGISWFTIYVYFYVKTREKNGTKPNKSTANIEFGNFYHQI